MPYYFHLRNKIRDKKERGRVIENLQKLSKQLDSDIPDKDADQNLLVATWNIRDFGKVGTRRGFGKREPETLFYIAEVLSRFDFIAIQEINELEEFEDIIGRHFRQPEEGLGYDGSPVAQMWRSIANPDSPL